MDFALKLIDFVLNMMNFLLKLMDFALKLMNFDKAADALLLSDPAAWCDFDSRILISIEES